MFVLVNGKSELLPETQTLEALLARLEPRSPFAVARNGDFISRGDYAACRLSPGDDIEIVHPAAGG